MNCEHYKWIAKLIPLSHGRPSLREFCVGCGTTTSGSRLGPALPMIRDEDLILPSYKYPGKTLGEIMKTDPNYLLWIVKESKTSDRIKKSAARLLCGRAYSSPQDGEEYDRSRCYNPIVGWECMERCKSMVLESPKLSTP